MSYTPRRALVVIDVQNEYVTGGLPIEFPPVEESLANIGRAMDAAYQEGIPVIVVQTTAPESSPIFARGSDGCQLHEVVASRPRDHFIDKPLPSCFANTGLADWLEQHEIDTIAVAGYMTHNCDATTIFDAVHLGFRAEFLCDAAGSLPYENRAGSVTAEQLHTAYCVVFQSRFAAVLSTDEWINAIQDAVLPERDNIHASNKRARDRRG